MADMRGSRLVPGAPPEALGQPSPAPTVTIEINGQDVEIDSGFLAMSPEDQEATIDEIAGSLPAPDQTSLKPEGDGAADDWQRFNILPMEKNMGTGELRAAMPGLLKPIADAIMLPGRVMSGETPINDPMTGHTSQAAIEGAMDLAGVATPSAPGLAVPRSAMRSIPPRALSEGQQAAVAGSRIGVGLPRAVASDSVTVQQMGKGLTTMPVVGSPLRRGSKAAIGQLDDAATKIQRGYGLGDTVGAGERLSADITKRARVTLPAMQGEKYAAVEALLDPRKASPLPATRQMAVDILARRQQAAIAGQSRAVREVADAISRPEGMTYAGIKGLRTRIGELLDNPQALTAAGIDQGELKQLYGSLSDDLSKSVLNAGGDDAARAFGEANTFAKMAANERAKLQKILGRDTSPEALVSKVSAMAGSTSRADVNQLMRLRGAVSKETWDEVAGAVLAKMGRDAEGSFSPDRFVTAWGKMSASGKKLMFGGKPELAKSLDDLAAVSSRFKRMNEYANPSGTAQNVAVGMIASPLAVLSMLEPTTLTATVGATAGGRMVSKLLANPVSAKKVAAWAKAYEQAAMRKGTSYRFNLENRAQALAVTIAEETGQNVRDVYARLTAGGA